MGRNGGYTLIETMVAVAILSVGLFGVISGISAARETHQRALYMSVAQNIAGSRMETYRSLAKDELNTVAATGQSSILPRGNTITCSAIRYPDSPSDKLYLASVRVTWPEGAGTRSIYYETLLYKP